MTPLRALLVTDSFPPGSGGSGWSTFELARQLVGRGHHVEIIHAAVGDRTGIEDDTASGLRVTRWRRRVPNVPVVRNVLKNEGLWPGLARYVAERARAGSIDLLHGQHVMTTAAAVIAGRRLRIPVVATVRDYWPVCYWSDLIVDASESRLCPACTVPGMRACVRHRAGTLGAAAWALIPYMRRNLASKQRSLADADAVIGVSSAITADLRVRARGLRAARVHTIPNPVSMDTLTPPVSRDEPPFVLYAGKLAVNKGVSALLPALDAAGIHWPLVVAGDGPLRDDLEAEAARRGRQVRWLGWCDRHEVLDLMRRCAVLAFPSFGPESLSRVLIEASALGTPIAAMQTGGTGDIVQDDVTGLLAQDVEGFARALARLANDAALRARLGAAAAVHARATFEAGAVCARVESVYHSVIAARRSPGP